MNNQANFSFMNTNMINNVVYTRTVYLTMLDKANNTIFVSEAFKLDNSLDVKAHAKLCELANEFKMMGEEQARSARTFLHPAEAFKTYCTHRIADDMAADRAFRHAECKHPMRMKLGELIANA